MSCMHMRRSPGLTGAAIVSAGLLAGGMITWSPAANAEVPIGGYADLVEKVAPAVVYIEVTGEREAQVGIDRSPFPPGSPFEDFFKRFGAPMPQNPDPEQRVGVGSGFIIDGHGEIVTNNHVVEGAKAVDVKLTDGRSFHAKVVGTDPMSDLALLKIETRETLPSVAFGDSANMRVGDAVMAVGNPFGLGGTVTTGIISATSRNINAGPYDDFIQTDAAINKGNSGGPLFNNRGEVIGVNTAIFSPSGGSVGIGFSVPSDLAKTVIAQIRENGSVERGWLGVRIQQVTADMAEALGMDTAKGALVSEVTTDSPAAKAGLLQGDVITAFAGAEIDKMTDLPKAVAAAHPGKTVKVEVLRGKTSKELSVELGRLGPQKLAATGPASGDDVTRSSALGVELAGIDGQTREQLELTSDQHGALVTDVDPEGPAAEHLMRGDVILSIDGATVDQPGDVDRIVTAKDRKEAALVLVKRNGAELFVGLRLKTA